MARGIRVFGINACQSEFRNHFDSRHGFQHISFHILLSSVFCSFVYHISVHIQTHPKTISYPHLSIPHISNQDALPVYSLQQNIWCSKGLEPASARLPSSSESRVCSLQQGICLSKCSRSALAGLCRSPGGCVYSLQQGVRCPKVLRSAFTRLPSS